VAQPLYSALLWRLPATTNAGIYASPLVPTGYVWDVRHVVIALGGQTFTGVANCRLYDSADSTLCEVPPADAWGSTLWTWELRQILDAGDYLQFALSGGESTQTASLRVSGYTLTTP
jgi:hypothetical protein